MLMHLKMFFAPHMIVGSSQLLKPEHIDTDCTCYYIHSMLSQGIQNLNIIVAFYHTENSFFVLLLQKINLG